jgi:hypothetical protein
MTNKFRFWALTAKKNSFGQPWNRDRRQSDGNFFFVKINFSPIKSPNPSRKSIKMEITNQFFILTSFIESKNLRTKLAIIITLLLRAQNCILTACFLSVNEVNIKYWFRDFQFFFNRFSGRIRTFHRRKTDFYENKISVALSYAVISWLSKWKNLSARFLKDVFKLETSPFRSLKELV